MEIQVVKPHYAEEEAYRMGFKRFEGMDTVEDPEDFQFSHFTETAAWANNVAPSLRAMAGFTDSGHGTYQEGGEVAAIRPGCEEDEPAAADLVGARAIYEDLVDSYRRGAHDAALGNEYGHSLE